MHHTHPDDIHFTRSTALAQLRKSFERFVPLPDTVWAEVTRPWRLYAVEQGDLLTRETQTERRFSLVVEGLQRLYFTTPGGGECTVAFVYPPDYSGVPDSFFLQTPSAYALEALSDGCILAIEYESLSTLMHRHRELERWAFRLVLHALKGRSKRERDLLTLTAHERYERLLHESPQIIRLAPLKHVASYLGMTPETLSRVRAATT